MEIERSRCYSQKHCCIGRLTIFSKRSSRVNRNVRKMTRPSVGPRVYSSSFTTRDYKNIIIYLSCSAKLRIKTLNLKLQIKTSFKNLQLKLQIKSDRHEERKTHDHRGFLFLYRVITCAANYRNQ